MVGIDENLESTEIDMIQIPKRRKLNKKRQSAHSLENDPSCTVNGILRNHLSGCAVELAFDHRLVALLHRNHVTREECSDWIVDKQGNCALDYSGEGQRRTERAAHSLLGYGGEKDPLYEN